MREPKQEIFFSKRAGSKCRRWGSRWNTGGSRILDYGLVQSERDTNLVWHYFRKFWPKKLTEKRPDIDPFRLKDHALCILCYESTELDRKDHVTVKLGKNKSPTDMVDHIQRYHKEEYPSRTCVVNSRKKNWFWHRKNSRSLPHRTSSSVFGWVSSVSFQPKERKTNLLRWPKPRWSRSLFIMNR